MITLTWKGHASFVVDFHVRESHWRILIDPYTGGPAAYEAYRGKTDIILITHSHYDHWSKAIIENVRNDDTLVIAPADLAREISDLKTLLPGQHLELAWSTIRAVQAYNMTKKFHPKGLGVGYLISFGGITMYHAGDTDHIPEMSTYHPTVALLPVGGTYTMNSTEAAAAVQTLHPRIAIPMHFGSIVGTEDDAEQFRDLLLGVCDVKILIPEDPVLLYQ